MLEAAAGKRVDGAVDDADRAAPFGPTIAIGNARPAPPDAYFALAIAGFFLQVAVMQYGKINNLRIRHQQGDYRAVKVDKWRLRQFS